MKRHRTHPDPTPFRVHRAPSEAPHAPGVFRWGKANCGQLPSPPDTRVMVTHDQGLVDCRKCKRDRDDQTETMF